MYILHLYQEKGTWFKEGIDLNEEEKHILPVDDLIDIHLYQGTTWTNNKIKKINRRNRENNLIINLGPQAISQFRKYHPFKLTLAFTNPLQTTARLETFVDDSQTEVVGEIVNWLLFLGKDVKLMQVPETIMIELKKASSEVFIKNKNII